MSANLTSNTPRRIALASLVALCLCGYSPRPATAQQAIGQIAEKPPAVADNPLPLNRVVLFNSGVGFFEHRGEVEGNAQVDLRFRVEEINDLLKSMILEDRGGGKISTITYGSKDPITKTLKTFPIDLTNNPTLGQLLDQLRGERLDIDAPTAINGILLGVEKRRREVGKDHEVVEAEYLNLLTDGGLRSVPMDSISRIKLANDKLDGELRQALAVLATGHNADKKTVSLNLLGQGKRPVRVGYIQATPVWKTSYRLVLSDKDAPYLQGWAIVENTTENDWNDVALTLMSGRPISYTMDLYEPLYAQRPVERLNLFASLRPQTYGQDMYRADERFAHLAKEESRNEVALRQRSNLQRKVGALAGVAADVAAREAPAAAAPVPSENLALLGFEHVRDAVSAAAAGEVGELFQYVIGTPVTLARQKSAMLPIVNESVKGEKVSIYNQAVQAKHPLNGLKLVNSTQLHLMQGPITVFDGGAYAGDAKIDDLPPRADRLISYALDLKTEVVPDTKGHPDQILNVRLSKGTMHVSRKHTRTHTFTVKNSDSKTKTVLVEVPLDTAWKLVSPKEPSEKTRDRYRFAVKAEPGKPATLTVEEERVLGESLALTNLDDNLILFYINQKTISPAVKAALQEIVKRKMTLEQVVEKRKRYENEIEVITQEQTRIRSNMNQLERNTDLYKRYVQKFGTQEDAVERLRVQIEELTVDEAAKRRALDEYLVNLDI